jgi:hypothetical protein
MRSAMRLVICLGIVLVVVTGIGALLIWLVNPAVGALAAGSFGFVGGLLACAQWESWEATDDWRWW